MALADQRASFNQLLIFCLQTIKERLGVKSGACSGLDF